MFGNENSIQCSLFAESCFFCAQIRRVYRTIKSLRPAVKFSISPFGLYRPGSAAGMPRPVSGFDPYSGMYADSLLWLQNGWVDFLAPQLYWSVNSTGQSFPMLLDWWLHHNPLNRCALHVFTSQRTSSTATYGRAGRTVNSDLHGPQVTRPKMP